MRPFYHYKDINKPRKQGTEKYGQKEQEQDRNRNRLQRGIKGRVLEEKQKLKKNNRKFKEAFKLGCLIRLLKLFFLTEQHFLKIKHINYPEGQFLMAMLHCHQCLTYGIKDKNKFYVMISASNDGEIIAEAAKVLNIRSVRGSSGRRGTAASLELIDKMKAGNSAAIMVDGPRGPKGKVKEGIVNIAKLTGVPITPVYWTSKDKNFLTLPSWDDFKVPIGFCRSIAVYGSPIYIKPDITKEETAQKCIEIEEAIKKLEADLNENYDKYLKQK